MSKGNEMEDRLLNAEEAAAWLGFSISALSQWRMAGKGPEFVRIGRAVRYKESALRAFVEARTKATSEGKEAANA